MFRNFNVYSFENFKEKYQEKYHQLENITDVNREIEKVIIKKNSGKDPDSVILYLSDSDPTLSNKIFSHHRLKNIGCM